MTTFVTVVLFWIACSVVGFLTYYFLKMHDIKTIDRTSMVLNGIYSWAAVLLVVFDVPGSVGNLIVFASIAAIGEAIAMTRDISFGLTGKHPRTLIGRVFKAITVMPVCMVFKYKI